jgi:methenyltetrahydrofolate cyclohydrolase
MPEKSRVCFKENIMSTTRMTQLSCEEFVEILAGKDPVPGGGGASALAGAIGTALGSMVGSLTLGKKKYADVESDIQALNAGAKAIEAHLLDLVEADAEVFAPLAAAYRNPDEKEAMEKCLLDATMVPLEIMNQSCRAIELLQAYSQKGSKMAISDAGAGAAILGGALKAASLNVFINTAAMTDKAKAKELNLEAEAMLKEYSALAEEIFLSVKNTLSGASK